MGGEQDEEERGQTHILQNPPATVDMIEHALGRSLRGLEYAQGDVAAGIAGRDGRRLRLREVGRLWEGGFAVRAHFAVARCTDLWLVMLCSSGWEASL